MSDLLPANASPFEKNLAAVNQGISEIAISLRTLWDAHTCPAHLLPWLAWAYSVDDWNNHWPESVKRQVVADSWDVHCYKGTPYSVQKALNSLNIQSQLREWWEQNGSGIPGTMTLTALINENIIDGESLLTPEMLAQITRIIGNAKRGVIHFDIELGLLVQETLAPSAALADLTVFADSTLQTLPVLPDEPAGAWSVAAVLSRHDYVDVEANLLPLIPETAAGSLEVAGIHRQLLLSELNFTGYLL